jgi:VIT1/CCC1 family predicted Fe2+/Mn2+ transporter
MGADQPLNELSLFRDDGSHAGAVRSGGAVDALVDLNRVQRLRRKIGCQSVAKTKHVLDERIVASQRAELTEHFVYRRLADATKNLQNRRILRQLSKDELDHHNIWKRHTKRQVQPYRLMLWKYLLIVKLLGLTFGLKLMERGEEKAQALYKEIARSFPAARQILEEEINHERQLLSLIDEERLRYVSSMILGLNDALVELTGALAGFTFALQNPSLIATTGLITGIAGSLSMAASEYLSTKAEAGSKKPFRAALYTGVAYVLTVVLLITPYFFLTNVYLCLGLVVMSAILVILFFTAYVSVAQDIPFRRRFAEMAAISLGIAAISFVIGYLVRIFLGVEV